MTRQLLPRDVARMRLQASGDLAGGDATGQNGSAVFDKAVADAVRRFQKRHGLAETGTVNAATQAAMNVPVTERIRQVELNTGALALDAGRTGLALHPGQHPQLQNEGVRG